VIGVVRAPCDRGVVATASQPGDTRQRRRRAVLVASILGSSMAFIDGSADNLALPALQQDLGATPVQEQWVIEIYTLSLAALVLVGGALGDRFGRRRVFQIGVAGFALASMACGLAATPGQLILARAVQGLGAALLVPGSLALIGSHFDGDARGRAFGVWSGATAVTSALGPVVGGWLIDAWSWRAVFFLNAPAAIATMAIAQRVPEAKGDLGSGRLDGLGALLVSVGLLSGTYGLIELQSGAGARPIAALVVGGLALVGFVWAEARSAAPTMPLGMFRSRTFLGANLLTLFLYAGLGGALFFVPFDLIQVHGYPPTQAGWALLPFVVVMSLLSTVSGHLGRWFGTRKLLVVGPIVAAVGFALFARPGVGGSFWTTFFPASAVLGLGMGITVAPLTTAVMGAVPTERSGAASGINNAVARAAGLIAVAAFGVVLVAGFHRELDRELAARPLPPALRAQVDAERGKLAAAEAPAGLPEGERAAVKAMFGTAFVAGFRQVMLLAALLALISAGAAALLVEDTPASPK
jgi:EmrB/QacA subfamily drug resistance transporter